MPDIASISVNYQPLPGAGSQESRWIRLQQQKQQDERVSLGQAAEAIDRLFGLKPCEDDLGSGGEAVTMDVEGKPAQRPDEQVFLQTMREVLAPELCEDARYWTAQVMVLCSHQSPGYTLRSESVEVLHSVVVEKGQSEELVFENRAFADLSWPYGGDLQITLPAGITAKVLGSTVNLSAPVSARLQVRYRSVYEIAHIRVPVQKASADSVLPSAALVAFWGDLAASIELEEPALDASATAGDVARLCKQSFSGSLDNATPKDCWGTVWHYQRCNCSKKRVNEWHDREPVQCPEGADASSYFVSNREQFDGFVTCPGEEDELNDPEYYEKYCCEPPPKDKSLPRCRKSYAEYRGGAEIEGGVARNKSIYGPNVRMVAVAPKDGICGELITEWDVAWRNCCDVAIAPVVDWDCSGQVIAPGGSAHICANYGMPPFTFESKAPGLWFKDGLRRVETYQPSITVYASTNSSLVCGTLPVDMRDACGNKLVFELRGSNGRWVLKEKREWCKEYGYCNVWHPDQSCPLSGAGTMLSDGVYELIVGATRLIERIDTCYEYTAAGSAGDNVSGCAECGARVNSGNRNWPPCIAGNLASGCRNPVTNPCDPGRTCPTLCANCGNGVAFFAWNRACGAYGWTTACSGPQVIQRDIYEWRC